MLRLILVFLGLYWGPAATALAADPLHEVRKSFAIGGKPIPAEIFADFGDAWMSDSRPIVVTIDAKAAIDSNRYADPIKTNGHWVEQAKPGPGGLNGPETMATNIAAQPPTACRCSSPPGAAAAAGRFIICIFLTPPPIAPSTRTARPICVST